MPLLIFLLGIFLYIYIEISLLITVGSAIGVLPLMLLMLGISILGIWLIRMSGIRAIWQLRSQIYEGKNITQAVISSLFFVISGFLLILPGFLSDILAFLLLLPITQKFIQQIGLAFFRRKFRFDIFSSNSASFRRNTADENTFDAEFERQQDENKWIK
ncbi:hypothetical protein A6B43_04865 [Vespertiliibacter pulmonis]|uniref:UPF0716 protein FxsA n=1 Tax=Vespertiliibacter pulmonis TaxID=1443036 RepID=A0A3N4VUA5_9PAST|nr:FxsA family protein [Vespertiliibacter pulmonis]QLB20905.1 hypothetical protein A6B43_04865 [Vespertiliibacter pulmonis]RPE83559.1 UPF0716 protein FxsA [Vespertiliibacter pulmonis]